MSLETMRRFHDDSILDTLELAQLSLRALTAGNAGPEAIAEAEAEIREINSKLQQSTITIAKRLQIKVICKDVGAEQYYKTWFGMLSKFAHPTPGLVIEVETGKEIINDEVLQPIFVMGLRSATELLNTTIQSMQFVETAEQAKFS